MPTLQSPNIIEAITDFVLTFSTPPLAGDRYVLNGFERGITPPSDSNDYCVIYPLSRRRRGTTIQEWDKIGEDVVRLKEYIELDIQVDCYSQNLFDSASRAQTFETVSRSFAGVDLFKKYGMDCLFADNLRNLSAIMDESQYQSRWCVILHLGYWRTVEIKQDFVNAVDIDVHNVDVKFPPK